MKKTDILYFRNKKPNWKSLKHINKSTDLKHNLEIEDKRIHHFVGPSGCGKSTLRMVAGLEEITSNLKIGDKVMNDVEPKDRDIAMVFQNYALYPHMTVYDNMAFGLKLRKVPKESTKQFVKLQESLDLEPLLDRKPKALSGGQRQRVAMGRAIVRNPGIQMNLFPTWMQNFVYRCVSRFPKSIRDWVLLSST